jgi:hypothetical protein
MSPLVTQKQLAYIGKFAELGMTTDVEIFRRVAAATPAPSDDYGDNVGYEETQMSRRGKVKGWLRATPATVQEVDQGAIVTVNTWALRVPLGTDILAGDEAEIDGDRYTVSSTDSDNTLLAYISCNLRKRE